MIGAPSGLQRVNKIFQSLRAGIRGLFLADGVSRFLLVVGGFAIATFFLDFLLNLPNYVRLTFLAVGLGATGWVLWRRVLRPLLVPISDDDLALFIERHHPELNDRLISAIQLSRNAGEASHFNSPELVDALVQEADQLASTIEFKRVLMGKHVGRVGAGALAVALVFGFFAWACPVHAGIHVKRMFGSTSPWPRRVEIRVLDFEGRKRVIDQGTENFTIRVEVGAASDMDKPGDRIVRKVSEWIRGGPADEVTLQYEFKKGEPKKEIMTPKGEGFFDYTFDRVAGPFSFTVKGGDDETERYEVVTLTPPAVDKIAVWYEFPRYLGRENTAAGSPIRGGHVNAPFFTKVRFEAETNEPLSQAWLVLGPEGRETVKEIPVVGERTLQGEFLVTEIYSEYHLRLVAKNTLRNFTPPRKPVRYRIDGKEDRKPEFQLLDPTEKEDVTEICNRPISFKVTDDHGVTKIAVRYQLRGNAQSEWHRVEITPEMLAAGQKFGDKSLEVALELDLAKFEFKVGDQKVKAAPGDQVEIKYWSCDTRSDEHGGANQSEATQEIVLHVKAITDIERDLQAKIDLIKQALIEQKRKQEAEYARARNLEKKFQDVSTLSAEQQRDVRDAKLEQNGIVDRLNSIRTDIERVKRRGVYNRVFNESAAEKLQSAVDILTLLVGDPKARERYGTALQAVQKLEEAGVARDRQERRDHFRSAQDLQGETITGIQKALDMLEKWANYQEVIRITREILEMQRRINKLIIPK